VRTLIATALLVAAALLGAGCVHVPPYERENLARPSMNPAREAREQIFASHVHDAREGATGGQGSSGAGCGCN
jgi:hypothetical protein